MNFYWQSHGGAEVAKRRQILLLPAMSNRFWSTTKRYGHCPSVGVWSYPFKELSLLGEDVTYWRRYCSESDMLGKQGSYKTGRPTHSGRLSHTVLKTSRRTSCRNKRGRGSDNLNTQNGLNSHFTLKPFKFVVQYQILSSYVQQTPTAVIEESSQLHNEP